MYLLVSVLAVVALASLQNGGVAFGAQIPRQGLKLDIDNEIVPHPHRVITKYESPKYYVQISQRPPREVKRELGKTVYLECLARGAPSPTIQWLKNDMPILDDDDDNNEILELSPTTVALVVATLAVSSGTPGDSDVYTCFAQAGMLTATASTTVTHIQTTESSEELSDLIALSMPSAPRVVQFYKFMLDNMGANVVLPCRATGRPRPHVYWRDNEGNMIGLRNPRMRVLPSGELLIANLRWSDLGHFNCTASSALGEDGTTTFLYPVKVG